MTQETRTREGLKIFLTTLDKIWKDALVVLFLCLFSFPLQVRIFDVLNVVIKTIEPSADPNLVRFVEKINYRHVVGQKIVPVTEFPGFSLIVTILMLVKMLLALSSQFSYSFPSARTTRSLLFVRKPTIHINFFISWLIIIDKDHNFSKLLSI